MNTMDKLLSELLYGQLQSIGLFTVKKQTIAELKAKLHDRYGKWLKESIAVLVQNQYLAYDGESLIANDATPIDLDTAWKKWDEEKTAWLNDPNSKAQVILVEATMRVLPEILLGKIPATEIMFPNSSMELVEGIYKHNEVADYFNEVLANTIVTYVKQRTEQDATARIRILEIGAGTGGTSAIVLPRLKPFQKHIEEYCYTDLSQAFLLHAEKEYGAENPYLTYRIFNVEKPVEEQGIAADTYDLVIATNVLHATKNISQTLLHAKTALQKNGLLILNELTSNTLFAHLTFGLLDGWWRYDDPEWRIPGCPLLTVETWQKVLKKAGYRSVFLPAEEHLDLCQQIIVAESDGVIRRSSKPRQSSVTVAYSPVKKQTEKLKAMPVKKQVPVRTTPAKKSGRVTEELLREKSTAYIKRLIGETLRIPTHQIKSSAPLEQYGIDSILVVQLTNSLRKDFANMSSTIFFEYQTIDALIEHLIETQKEALIKVIGLETQEAVDETSQNEIENVEMTASASSAYTDLPVRKTRRFLSVREQESKEADSPSSVVRDVAIIGLSGRYPQAKNVDEFWKRLKEGKNCISEIPKDRWDWKNYFDEEKGKKEAMYTKWGGFIDDMDKFDPLFFQISPKEAEEMDPQERLFLQEAYASIEDAGYTPTTLCESRKVGVFVGVMNGNYPTGATYWSIANRLSYLLNFQGPSVSVDTACSASLTAIHLALESLYSGTSECAIAGGVNLIVDPVHYMKLSALTMLSPTNQCKSFGDQADGFVDGEGVGAIVLKPLDKAIADGDHIYGVIKGSMMNAGGKTNGYTVPNPQAQAQLVADALQRANVHARTVSYLEAHGTGTELGDPIEVTGLTRAFEKDTQDKQFCALGSAKSNIGHCESAAGIAGVTKILLQLKHAQLVPSLHSSTLNPNIDFTKTPFVVQQELAEWKRPIVELNGTTNEYPRIAGISSFGAGGSNAHVIIEEYIPEEQQQSSRKITPQNPAILVLSAKNAERLYEKAEQLVAFIQEHSLSDANLADMAYTLQVGRVAMEERLAVLAGSMEELQQKLTAYVEGQEHIADLYRGQVNRNQEMLDILTSDDELEETIARWMERGKYSKLLDLWVKGLPIDWNKLYQEEQPNRISLPTYPFAKESYWIEAKSVGSSAGVGSIHPFLHQNTSDFLEQRFSSTFTGQEFFLSDHVIKGKRVLPSAAYLEMARAAIELATGGLGSEQEQEGLRFKNMVWTQPLAVGSEPVQAHIELYPEANGEIVFEIYSDSMQDQEQRAEIVHSQGSAVLCSIPNISPLDLTALQEQCNQSTLSAEQCYETFKKMGVDYGPAHRGIEQILIGQGQVLAKLSLPSSVAKTQGQFGLHPSLLDAALQSSLGLMMATSDFALILPFAIEELEIVGACSASMWALIRYSEGHKAGDKVEKFDIDLCDENGNVQVRMKGFSTRKIANESVGSGAEAPKASVTFEEEKALDSSSLMEQATHYFKKLLSSVIKLPANKMEAEASLEKYGVDSIVAMQMTKELEKRFGSLPKTLFFEYQTIKELTGYFLENYRESLMHILGVGENAEAPLTQEPEATNVDEWTAQTERRSKKHKSKRFASLRMETPRQNGALDIAIIGVSGRYPQARNIQDFWKNLRDGKDCITEIPKDRWDHSLYFDEAKDKIGKSYSKWGGFIDGVDQFDPLFFYISPREAELMDPQERLFLQCVYETIEDAGYTRDALGKHEGLGGNVGVYVGVMYEEYQLYASAEQALGRALTIAGSPASIANRVSYFCNFHGPSMAVDTMCSSSLTGIHLACHSLQRGECEVAIAGGVNVSIHPNKYLYLSQGKFASSKGRCESFGEGGDGYVPGEGVGAVLLKPLARAIADGDHIYGVIKGSAINHGGKTNGYTVPNPHAQSRVIRRAFEEAGIHPRTVSYIEAHGTGTSLGDPIEIAGLTKTFQEYTKENQFCAIGSAKSNIGHGESAAGIAGLTKILLQMKYKRLVPSLHSRTLNPNIDFSKTPFVVQQELAEWKRPVIEINGVTREYPRIAGISSFGAGGANAHLVIEEYFEEEHRPPISISAKHPAVIVLSAKNKDRLREQVQQLLSAIREQVLTDNDLAEIAYTLQVGREAMEERLAVIVKSISELEAKLTGYLEDEDDRQDLFTGQVKRNKETMDVFAADEDLQQAIDTWITKGKYAKILQMWVQGLIFDWNKLYGDTKPRRISLPAYPFARERYWLPKDSQATGFIAAGALATLHPMLHQNTSTLSEQRHSSTFTGQEFFLRDHVVKGQKVLPGVAYLEMARVAVDLAAGVRPDNQSAIQLKNIVWAKPVIVEDAPIQVHTGLYPEENGEIAFEIYSQPREAEENLVVHSQGRAVLRSAMKAPTLDLSAIQAQCTANSYSNSQCYETLRGIGLAYGPSHQGIEKLFVGPDQVLAKLILPSSVTDTAGKFVLHPSIMDAALQASLGFMMGTADLQPSLPFALEQLNIYSASTTAVWALVRYSDGNAATQKVQKLDIDLCDEQGKVCVSMKGFTTRVLEGEKAAGAAKGSKSTGESSKITSTLMLQPAWIEQAIPKETEAPEYEQHVVMLCELGHISGESISSQINGAKFLALQSDQQGIAERFQAYAVQAFEEIKALLQAKPKGKVLIQIVTPLQSEQRLFAGIAGLLKTAQIENPKVIGQLIQIDSTGDSAGLAEKLKANSLCPTDSQIRYEFGKRYMAGWSEVAVPQDEASMPWKDNGIYLITGGAGGLGLIFAEEMAEKARGITLILTGRSELTEEKQAKLRKLADNGTRVEYRQVDVTQKQAVEDLIQSIQSEFGDLHGIIHSAGVTRDNFILKKTKEEVQAVLAPKVAGLIHLDEATKGLNLDFFVLFSSAAGSLGNMGQADYATANAFMDNYSAYRNEQIALGERQGQTISINWPLWKEGGMQVDEETEKRLWDDLGMVAMQTASGINCLYRGLASGQDQLMVMEGDLVRMKQRLMGATATSLTSTAHSSSLQSEVQASLLKMVAELLKVDSDDMDIHAELHEYGFDQIKLTEFTNKLNQAYELELTPAVLVEYPTLFAVSQHLMDAYRDRFIQQFQPAESPSTPAKMEKEQPVSVGQPDVLRAKVREYLKKEISAVLKLPAYKIDEDAPLDKYGIDSVMAMQLTNQLEKAFGSLSKTLLYEYQNIEDLTDYLFAHHRDKIIEIMGAGKTAETSTAVNVANELPTSASITDHRRRFSEVVTREQAKKQTTSELDIAIIGVSGRYPQASHIQEFWNNLREGKDCITEIPQERWDHSLYFDEARNSQGKAYSKWGGFIDGVDQFDPLFFHISPREAEMMDPQERLFLETVWNLLEEAGHTREVLQRQYDNRVGVYVGAMYQPYHAFDADMEKGAIISLSSYHSIANRVSYFFNLQGPSMAIDTACSSSAIAIYHACESLIKGESSLAIAGGVNVSIHPKKYLGLSQAQMIGSHADSRSFGDGDGYLPAEGVGAVLLKPLAKAMEDGDSILAVIKSAATNHGGRTNGFSVPNPNAQAQLIEENFARAGIDPRTISYVEAAANGSLLGDPIELKALTNAFSKQTDDVQFCAIGSVKSNIGHAEAASGISQLTKVILQLQHQELVPSIKAEPLNPHLNFAETPFYLQKDRQKWDRPVVRINGEEREVPRRATISSFGAGGSNVHLILEEYIPPQTEMKSISSAASPQIVVFSAKNTERLRAVVQQMLAFAKQQSFSLADFAYTLQMKREAMECRLAMVVQDRDELIHGLQAYLEAVEQGSEPTASIPIYTGDLEEDHAGVRNLLSGKVGDTVLQVLFAENNLEKLALHWTQGGKIPWEALHPQERRTLSLPTYPFARERYWLSTSEGEQAQLGSEAIRQPVEKATLAIDIDPDSPTEENILRDMAQFISRELHLSEGQIKINKYFLDYGMDSIMVTKLIRHLEQRWNIKIRGREVLENPTMKSLAHLLAIKIKEWSHKEIASTTDFETMSPDSGERTENLAVDMLQKFKEGLLSLEEIEQLIDKGGMI
ncbi:acyl transferase domain-containing protein [Brevibacillus sp. AG162]|uniref:SDR family NAD(P)-dependent oxidoreductase n=1 Tax=Brevibacillus sp. AG162 TaxID=2572910 RepID=UPI0011506E26|nr:SDR family NAD(P)-dependent oxidoreductase [Brevibacillus sp. AG162]TQK74548.1 acyl transferase domain-containing protein [Brevibacillus sp. AG162]